LLITGDDSGRGAVKEKNKINLDTKSGFKEIFLKTRLMFKVTPYFDIILAQVRPSEPREQSCLC
jgi:hypothetical protein